MIDRGRIRLYRQPRGWRPGAGGRRRGSALPRVALRLAALTFGAALAACGGQAPAASDADAAPPAASRAAPRVTPAPPRLAPGAGDRRQTIVFLGDSLTAGLGLAPEDAYPARLQARIDASGYPYQVVNHGVSGDTSAAGLSRLDWALGDAADGDILVVALGGNDGLRGIPPAEMARNLAAVIEGAQVRRMRVLLAGVDSPANWGAEYRTRFQQVFRDLAETYDVPLVPSLLDGVFLVPELNQADGIHPTAEGAAIVADTVWDALEPLLASGTAAPPTS